MAVTAYTGPPGSGKSYALVSEVIVNGILGGRRVLTNIDGINPEEVYKYCRKKKPEVTLGELVTFHGNDAHDPMFWPHEGLSDDLTFVKGGDLVVFDEWKLYFADAGKLQSETVVPFIRWHRHLTDDQGRSCDLVIATQIIGDLHRSFRGTLESSLKFKKLSMVGLEKAYRYDVYSGHKQNKDDHVRPGNGTYKKEIFPLYKTSQADDGTHSELKTDSRSTVFGAAWKVGGVLCLVMLGFGVWGVYDFFTVGPAPVAEAAQVNGGQVQAVQANQAPPAASTPDWRIAGHLVAMEGPRVVLQGRNGEVRYVAPDRFVFDGDRPVLGTFEGKRVTADEWVIREEESRNDEYQPTLQPAV